MLMTLKQVYDQIQRDLKNGVDNNRYDNVPLHHLRGTVWLVNDMEARKIVFQFRDRFGIFYDGEIDLNTFGKLKVKKMVNEIKRQVKEGL